VVLLPVLLKPPGAISQTTTRLDGPDGMSENGLSPYDFLVKGAVPFRGGRGTRFDGRNFPFFFLAMGFPRVTGFPSPAGSVYFSHHLQLPAPSFSTYNCCALTLFSFLATTPTRPAIRSSRLPTVFYFPFLVSLPVAG